MFLFVNHWNLDVFNTSTLKQIFWKTKTFFKKLECRLLVESAKTENATFSYKTALLEANIKTNRMGSSKWTYHWERSFASIYFNFLKFFSCNKNLLQRIDLMYQLPKYPHLYFSQALELYFRVHFLCQYA